MDIVNPFKCPKVEVLPDGRMSTKNTAIYTGLSLKTLAMKRCGSTGPPFVKRGRVFYFKHDVDTWLAEARYSSTAQAANHGKQLVHARE